MFNVELSVSSFGGHAVVALYGNLDLAEVAGLASHLITAVAACGPSIIVDLAGLELIDSCGLGVLVRVLKWTREKGGDMALAAPQPQIRKVFSATGLIDAFCAYPSVEQATRHQAGPARACSSVMAALPPRPSVLVPPASGARSGPLDDMVGSASAGHPRQMGRMRPGA